MITDIINNLRNEERGSILIQTGLMFSLLVGLLGVGVDLGRAYLYRSQLSGALDAAALAGAKSFHSASRDDEIQAFFDNNFDGTFMDGTITALDIQEVDTVNRTLSVGVSGQIDTVFMKLFGFKNMDIDVSAETTSRQTGLQLVMVLDGTGSMRSYDSGTQRMVALKSASTTLVNSLFGDESSNEELEIAVLPYVTTVNVGHLLADEYIDTSSVPASYTYHATALDKWNGCVEARATTDNLDSGSAYDVIVGHEGQDWTPFLWRPGYDNHFYSLTDLKGPNGEDWGAPDYQRAGGSGESTNDAGPNINCPAPALDFSSTKSEITNYIDTLYYSYNRGGTIANIGMIWGWRMLDFGGVFNNDVEYNDSRMLKAAILMTDGENWIIDGKEYWGPHAYYDDNNTSDDNNDAYDDDGDGKCPQCEGTFINRYGYERSNARYDGGDERNGPQAWDAVNGPDIGERYLGDYSAYGRRDEGRLEGATTRTASTNAINERLAYVCASMKGMGITIYTVTFGSGATSSTLQSLYEGCATDTGKYFHAPTSSELEGAFEAIANDLSDLRLSK